MNISEFKLNQIEDIGQLFRETFTTSMNEAEGALIPGLVINLMTTTDENNLFGFTAIDQKTIIGAVILTELYLPVAVMLFGLIFRGVAFDFRAKVPYQQKWRWNNKFFYGSLLTSLAQGYMLGSYITGFDHSLAGIAFSCLVAVILCSAYCLVGACWLIMKTEGTLQEKSVKWAKYHLVNSVAGFGVANTDRLHRFGVLHLSRQSHRAEL